MVDDRRVTVLFELPEGEAPGTVGEVVAAVANVGMDVATVGIRDDLDAMVAGLRGKHPDLVVNLVQRFAGNPRLAPDVAAALELLDLPYTGASPSGLYLGADRDLARRLLAAHDVPAAPAPPDVVVAAIGNDRPTVVVDDPECAERVSGLVARVWAALRLRDYALLGIRFGPHPALVSAVPNPPLGRREPFARICASAGLLYEPMIAWILDEAWDRGLVVQPTAKSA